MNINVTKKNKVGIIERQINKLKEKNTKVSNFILNYYDFYKKELYKKHMVLYIISLFLFFVMLVYYIRINGSSSELGEAFKEASEAVDLGKIAHLKKLFTEKLLFNLVLVISGITPYVYIPVLGVVYSGSFALEIIALYNNVVSNMNVTFVTIGSIIQLFGICLTSAIGVYICKYSTKRFKYNQRMNFTLNDVKMEYYKIKKNEDKIKEVTKKEEERKNKIEKLNVKISYKNVIVSFIVSCLIMIIGGLIALI